MAVLGVLRGGSNTARQVADTLRNRHTSVCQCLQTLEARGVSAREGGVWRLAQNWGKLFNSAKTNPTYRCISSGNLLRIGDDLLVQGWKNSSVHGKITICDPDEITNLVGVFKPSRLSADMLPTTKSFLCALLVFEVPYATRQKYTPVSPFKAVPQTSRGLGLVAHVSFGDASGKNPVTML